MLVLSVVIRMTEKRYFIVDVDETYQENAVWQYDDKLDEYDFVCFEDDSDKLVMKLNEFAEENKELKTFKDKVFDKINEYIETSDKYRTPIGTIEYGENIGYWNGVYQRMNRLKRELIE